MSYRWTLLVAVLSLPLLELGAHALILLRVPSLADYRAASDFIRSELEPGDLLTAAPAFIDPILRWQLGDRMPLAMAGRSDDARYRRMWVLSIRGAQPSAAPHNHPELTRQLGAVTVRRYRLPAPRVLYDFVEAWPNAEARIVRNGASQICPLRDNGVPRGGGLGRGVLMPVSKRFECDPRVPWLFVSDVVLEDLDNTPRHCIWQHPQGLEPITLTFHDVPLGAELVFYGGIYYEHERMRTGAAIDARIAIDGQIRASFQHIDGDGFRSLHVPTNAIGKPRADVSISVTTNKAEARSFCWAATTRGPEPTP